MRKKSLALAFSVALAVTAGAAASDVVVNVTFDGLEAVSDELVAGTMTAEVFNHSGETIGNVNLRSGEVEDVAASKEVLQFGSLTPGAAGVVHVSFHAPAGFFDSGRPSHWRLDYDEAGGGHQQVIVNIDQQP